MRLYPTRIILLFSILIVTQSILPAFAGGEQKDAKLNAIDRYLEVAPVKELMENVVLRIAKTMPEDQRRKFIDIMTNRFDLNLIEQAMKQAMFRHFTLREIELLVTFYSTPEGRSLMGKMGDYMADVMPVVQSELIRVSTEYSEKQKM